MVDGLRIVPCGPERAAEVHALTQAAFAPHDALDPPSGAVRESIKTVRDDLAAGGGAIAELDGRAVGCLRWLLEPTGDFYARRLAVDPGTQRRGIGTALMLWCEDEARRRACPAVAVGVRSALDDNLAFYRSLGYVVVREDRHDGYDHTTAFGMRKELSSAPA